MFKIIKKSKKSKARLGKITTPHGVIHTPFFMPDATRGAVKDLSNDDLKRLGLSAMVINTYHLYLQPGMEVIKKAHGIHGFMNWDGPLLSDSGGYQVFSLIHKNKGLGKITDDKVIFRSPLDGTKHELTPGRSMQIQFDLGVDMMVCLDDCPPNDVSQTDMTAAVNRTIAWAKRCQTEFEKQIKKRKLGTKRPLLFGVIQGGVNLELRKKCADALFAIGFDGYGFGARHVDGEGEFLAKPLEFTADLIPEDKLRFGLGIGTPEDIVRCVPMGWDMFDCVIPTREARHGKLYLEADVRGTKRGLTRTDLAAFRVHPRTSASININNSRFATDFTPINPASKLPELCTYSKAYLHHLFKTQESLAWCLATLNNLEFYLELMKQLRLAIKNNQI